ncbi:ketopantoate reductase family protein [Cohnella boryungensis]|uniref:2-dehydropantoate 2-reductase n=1 Tax=Cohnella boryungensis TaxID=768479 RepID=A0ABV8SFF2_9BACL
MKPTIAVLGGGSIGLLLAGRLQAAGQSCVVWTKTRSQAERIRREGLGVDEGEGTPSQRLSIEAVPWEDADTFEEGVVLLAVKQTSLTAEFLSRLAVVVPPSATLVALQNGVGHEALLRRALPGRTIILAVTTEGALRIDDTTVRHTGRGDIRLGDDGKANPESLRNVEGMLKAAGFSVFLSKELGIEVKRKLLINAVINPLTAILRIPNGGLTETPERMELARALFDETFSILSEYGVDEQEASWDTVMRVCAATRDNRSSMLQDAVMGKPTEIDSINGEIVRLAARLGRDAPWNRAVTALVKAIH